ncbi:MAG TPA: glycosyltransferase [Gammaproteobacteria bacterium]|nr:glycosyltransferase [Gammaproteobacteria bacterium]
MPLERNTCRRQILIFNHSYATQFIDIANQYAQIFPKEQYEVTVSYLTGKEDAGVRAKTLAENVIFMDCPPYVTRGLKIPAVKAMLDLHKKKGFEAVICHRYKPTYIMLWVSLFRRIPKLISVMHELGTMRSVARRILIAALAPKNMIFAGVSNAVRNDMRQDLWNIAPGRVITLYNMIDVDLTEPRLFSRKEARGKLGLTSEDFVFGTLGRLAVNKDQKTLIAAFAEVKKSCANAKLIILGDGQLESQLKQQVEELSLTNDVIFAGFLADGFRYMKAFDVYVSSSIQEAFGRVLLEAMVAKVPTIATRVNGMPEVLGDSGIIVDPKQPSELAKAMLQAYQTPESGRLEWGEKHYQRATKEFSIPKFREMMGEILLPGLDSNQ